MKIICFNDILEYGGAAAFTRAACNILAQFGNDVTFVYSLTDPTAKLVVADKMHPKVKLIHISEFDRDARNAFSQFPVSSRVLGSEPIHRAILDHMRKEKYDVVYALNLHDTFSIRLISRIRKIFDGPILFQYNDNDLFCMRKFNYRTEYRKVCRACIDDIENSVKNKCWQRVKPGYFDANIANRRDGYYQRAMDSIDSFLVTSSGSMELLRKMNIAPERIVSIHNPVNVNDFIPGAYSDHFVFYGMPYVLKGVEVILRALQIAQIKAFHFYCLGNNDEIRMNAKKIALQRNFDLEFRSDITWRNGLYERVANARAVIVPSQWDSPCEMAVSEAASMGRALITSEYSSRTPLVQAGKNALVFSSNDHIALANALTEMSKNTEMAQSMGKSSRAIAEKFLTLDEWYETFLKAVNQKESSIKMLQKSPNRLISKSSTARTKHPNIHQLRSDLFNDTLSSLERRRINGEIVLPERTKVDSAGQLHKIARELIAESRHDEAIKALNRLLDKFPGYALAHNDLGALYFSMGDKEEALEHYQRAADLDPDNSVFQKNLADFHYTILGQVDSAIEFYVKVLDTMPEDIDTLLMLGHISVFRKEFEVAKKFYNKVLEIEPWNKDARENLGLLEKREKADDENETALSAEKCEPENSDSDLITSDQNPGRQHFRETFWFEWVVVDNCNLNCDYCVNKGEYSQKPVKQIKHIPGREKEIAERIVFLSKYAKKVQVNLTGGEPLLSDCILDVISILSKAPNIHIQLITNLVLIDRVAESLKEYRSILNINGSLHVAQRSKRDIERIIEFINSYKDSLNIQLTQVRHQFSEEDTEKILQIVKAETGLPIHLQTYIPPWTESGKIPDAHEVRDASFVPSKGKRCCLGYSHFLVLPDGTFCYGLWCQDRSKKVGNFLELSPSTFDQYILDDMKSCSESSCGCNYNTFNYDSYRNACKRLGYSENEIFGPENLRKEPSLENGVNRKGSQS